MGHLVYQSGAGANDEGGQAIFTQNAFAAGIDNADPSDAPINARQPSWVAFDTTILQSGFRLTTAPGAGRTYRFRVHHDNNASIGAASAIVDPAVTVITDLSAAGDIPALDPTSDSTIRNTLHYLTFWPDVAALSNPGQSFRGYEYSSSAHPEYVWLICNVASDPTNSATFSATDAYAAICDVTIDSTATTQAIKQVQLPAAGRLKYAFAVWRGYTSTTTVEAALQVGMLGAGVDSAIVIPMVGAGTTTPYTAVIDTTEVDILDTDFINWRITRTAGAATAGSIMLGIGFVPSL